MCRTIKIDKRRRAFTLVEMIVVILIILIIAALAAAFAPRIADDTNLSRAVDNLEQWLLTAKMRAKRDGLATGIRFVQAQGDAAQTYSQCVYIQQPDPLSGGYWTSTGAQGGVLTTANTGTVTFSNVDFSLGGLPQTDSYNRPQWLVQAGDYLEVRDGGVYLIGAVTSGTTLTLANAGTAGSYDASLSITAPGTTNYRILRQPRILIGEEPLTLPNNFAIDTRVIPGTTAITTPNIPANSVIPNNTTIAWSNVTPTASNNYDILFSPTGAVVGANAGSGTLFISVYDMTMTPFDINRVGIIGIQTRTGFMGAYGTPSGPGTANYDPFYLARNVRESGL